jgi:hypothetical protein
MSDPRKGGRERYQDIMSTCRLKSLLADGKNVTLLSKSRRSTDFGLEKSAANGR